MNKKERENRLAEQVEYWELADKIRDISLDALSDMLSVGDVISVLDRIKVELLQQEVIIIIEDSQKQAASSEIDNNSDEESEIEGDMVLPSQANIKAGSPFVNLSELKEGMEKGMLNN